ncbi:MAG: FtsW/RodA/SpoVE family cell cycle protein, partial [Pseudomonadales bacterium]|nr:FtsW/RodA/SpoVE family cell cycle protein [Pseudomonadales bacterium]
GLGNSVQKLFYLPEAHTDFVFAVLAEETGLVGASLAIGLFLLLVWQCFAIGRKASNAGQVFAAYLAYGIGLWLGGQAFINIGVNLGVLPTKGLTLPLFSYGGSSLITTLIAIGLLFRVAHESQLPTRAAVRSQSKQRRAASKNRRRA